MGKKVSWLTLLAILTATLVLGVSAAGKRARWSRAEL